MAAGSTASRRESTNNHDQRSERKTIMSEEIIAVTGATGLQGRAIARRLLADGWKVRALTRDTNKPAARELASKGAEVVPGDMESRSQLEAAFRGAYGVFSVQNYWLPNVRYDGEIRQGKNVAD